MTALDSNFFLAVPLPDYVRTLLEQRALQLQSALPFKSWVRPGDYHITLVFLGKSGFKQINQLKTEMSRVVQRHSAFRVTIDKIDIFGKKTQPRVLWAGVSADEAMYDLQRDLQQTCARLGFDLDDRPFKPHITLARKWEGEDALDLSTLEKNMAFDNEIDSFVVKEMALFQSNPKQIPQYQALKLLSLQ